MDVRRGPLTLAAALLTALLAAVVAGSGAGQAAADPDRWPVPRLPAPKVSVRPPAPHKGVTTGRRVRVPNVTVQRSPVPRVSIAMPRAKRRAAPKVTVPHVTIYPDGLCGGSGRSPKQRTRPDTGTVRLGDCPRNGPRKVPPRVAPLPVPPPVPVTAPPEKPVLVPPPSPKPTPAETTPRSRAKRLQPPARRKNPLGTVTLTVVLVTAITATTAVAFKARR